MQNHLGTLIDIEESQKELFLVLTQSINHRSHKN